MLDGTSPGAGSVVSASALSVLVDEHTTAVQNYWSQQAAVRSGALSVDAEAIEYKSDLAV